MLYSFHVKFWCCIATGPGILTGFVSTCPVMAACNLMVQKRVYEYFIPLKYFCLTVDITLNSDKMFGIETVLHMCFVRQIGRFP